MKKNDNVKVLNIPKIINTDLTYYMQFGWKRLKEPTSKRNISTKTYEDRFEIQNDDIYSGNK